MKTKSFPKEIIVVLILTLLAILITGVLITIRVVNLPIDVIRKDITLEEAQSLVTFPICLPTYVPTGIDHHPQIIYDADAANVPEEIYIRLRYRSLDDQAKIFEVYQRYTPEAGMKTEYPDLETFRNSAAVVMIWWIADPKHLSVSETNKAVEQTRLEAEVFKTDQTVWWLYEVIEPSEYRSTMTKWVKNHVEYRILSFMPVDEIKEVTESMMGCSNP